MVIKLLRVVIPIFIGMTTIFSTCKKRFGCADNVYSFQMGIKAYPNYDSIKVGDTLWFDLKEPTTLEDVQTGKIINYSGAENLGSNLSFLKLSLSNSFNIKAADMFDYVLIAGFETKSMDVNFEKEYLFEESNHSYAFKLGVIPKSKGTFVILYGSAANVYRKSDKCTKASFSYYFTNTDQHYYLNPNYQGGPLLKGGDYYFKVN